MSCIKCLQNGCSDLLRKFDMFLPVYSLIHDVILWNIYSLKQNFLFQGEFLTVLITKLLHDTAERSREDWHSEELAQRLILKISKMSKHSGNCCRNPLCIYLQQTLHSYYRWWWNCLSADKLLAVYCNFWWQFLLGTPKSNCTDAWANKEWKAMGWYYS